MRHQRPEVYHCLLGNIEGLLLLRAIHSRKEDIGHLTQSSHRRRYNLSPPMAGYKRGRRSAGQGHLSSTRTLGHLEIYSMSRDLQRDALLFYRKGHAKYRSPIERSGRSHMLLEEWKTKHTAGQMEQSKRLC